MHIIFLPGGGGAPEFWHALGALLPADWKKTYLSWPGLGNQPHDPTIRGFDDLVALAEKEIQGPTILIAQSMGGIVGIRLALKRPEKITHLVLVATSGGVDVAALGAEDWRLAYLNNFPEGARWITTDKPDHTDVIPNIACPTLLIWGDSDPISPVSIGCHLSSMIAGSELHVIEGGNHSLAKERAAEIAPLILNHLNRNAD
jgi:pimeloyl-ACP methyl ester carboxylesterase